MSAALINYFIYNTVAFVKTAFNVYAVLKAIAGPAVRDQQLMIKASHVLHI